VRIAGWIKVALSLFLVLIPSFVIYSNTFSLPFLFDGKGKIAENPLVKDLGYFVDPSGAERFYLYDSLKSRYVGLLSFALNYWAGGLDVWGYHAVNLAIHIINGLLVYFLVILTFRTPFLEGSSLRDKSRHIALLASALFVAHPVQTEAVTYIVQRLASLASRLAGGVKARYAFYALSLVSAVLAMKTKENAFTLPLAIAMYEFFFFIGERRKRILLLLPLMLTMLIIPLTLLDIDRPLGEVIGSVGEATRLQSEVSRGDYLLTQFSAVVTYLRLLFLPINQNLDYDYPVYRSFFEPRVFLSFMLLLAIIASGVYCLVRSRWGNQARPVHLRLVSFGIFWFFLTLSVESSFIPILDVIFEHRTYLPMVGASSALAVGMFMELERLNTAGARRALVGAMIAIMVMFAMAAYQRNTVWGSEISLWTDVVEKSPRKARGYNNLGFALYEEGFTQKALPHYLQALQLNPDFATAHNNLGRAYLSMGLEDEAIGHFVKALELKPGYLKAGNNLGAAYLQAGQTEAAIRSLEVVVAMDPDYATAHYNLALAYIERGLREKAREELQEALRLRPGYQKARRLSLSLQSGD